MLRIAIGVLLAAALATPSGCGSSSSPRQNPAAASGVPVTWSGKTSVLDFALKKVRVGSIRALTSEKVLQQRVSKAEMNHYFERVVAEAEEVLGRSKRPF